MIEKLPLMPQVWLQTTGWQPSGEQQEKFQQLYAQICQVNRQVNLTRITESEEFWEKHIWDSVRGILPYFQMLENWDWGGEEIRVVDIGTGGGFPGFPAAIVFPRWRVTLLDSIGKKIACLRTMAGALELENVVPYCDRAEKLGQQEAYREQYHIALLRAVAPSAVCAEYALPLLQVGGVAVLYRGGWEKEQEKQLQVAVAELGGEIAAIAQQPTPMNKSDRHYIYIRKTASTPSQFPRNNVKKKRGG
ncbi:16S rRNA (guanine(527)-N(7))-methyltransferase RsmG [Geitlerinema sp. PCC 9228]|jgi:16S rRNA (guanine527-N7)-methyltransferase|uniref:16S rRNA (guanine(527)-N(7))-methyltransferase RsmG n=1 Tax=Geitlerinema sp. PCC 9228 TaxID=111611 RepID=UPI0008F9A7DB|nr:16S rRNA (guanine(527)-N(7))-methyltransferase RsmG [Geitlerinema sp. PCC 9228]